LRLTSLRPSSWADKFRPDGMVVPSLGDGTGRGSILLNPVTFCCAEWRPRTCLFARSRMIGQAELHRLVHGLDSNEAKQQLHVLVNAMDEETARETLARIRDVHRGFLEKRGFSI
jgi:hypothetical protein